MRLPDEAAQRAALIGLAVLQTVMLAALLARSQPHPPVAVAIFALAPFLGASLAVTAAAISVGPLGSVFGRIWSVLACLCALVSFGPQKYFDPQFTHVWPAIIAAQMFVLVIVASLFGTSATARGCGDRLGSAAAPTSD